MTTSPVDHTLVEQYVRTYARGNMRNTVRIDRSADPVFDQATGTLQAPDPVSIYDGPARIYSVTGPVQYSVGDEPQFYSSTNVSIPMLDDAGVAVTAPHVNDTVTVLAAPGNPGMIGRTFQVQDVESGGQWSAVHRMSVVGIQNSPNWSAP